jgi:hypothetical protein
MVVHPEGLEPPTPRSVAECSIPTELWVHDPPPPKGQGLRMGLDGSSTPIKALRFVGIPTRSSSTSGAEADATIREGYPSSDRSMVGLMGHSIFVMSRNGATLSCCQPAKSSTRGSGFFLLVHPTGLEPVTPRSGGECSVPTELRVHVLYFWDSETTKPPGPLQDRGASLKELVGIPTPRASRSRRYLPVDHVRSLASPQHNPALQSWRLRRESYWRWHRG